MMEAENTASPITRLLALGGELAPPKPGEVRRRYDLAHTRILLAELDAPQTRFPAVLIAGTNGKGSTASVLASILGAGGTKTGLYTSPHLDVVNERIKIVPALGTEGVMIADETLSRLYEQVEQASARLVARGDLQQTPSFFETMTAIAFLYFAEESVGIAVLEVGMGGRLDATNVVEPLVSVLTDISLDHTYWLGDTIAAISREKAGILRQGGVLVTLPQHPEANQAIGEAATPLAVHAINAAHYLPMRQGAGAVHGEGSEILPRNRYRLTLPPDVLGGAEFTVDSGLSGSHQQRNMALSIATAVTLFTRNGFPLTVESLERGIREAAWPGRLETGIWQGVPVLMDAAHNPAGAWTLRAALSGMERRGRKTLVFGCMADKSLDEVARILFPIFDELVLTATASPRAAKPEALAALAKQTGVSYSIVADPADALASAIGQSSGDDLVVVAGSIYLLGDIRSASLRSRHLAANQP